MSPKICTVVWQELQIESTGSLLIEFFHDWERSFFCLLRSSIDLMRLIHIMEGNLLYSKFILLLYFLKIYFY